VSRLAVAPAIPALVIGDSTTERLEPLAPGVEMCHDARGDLLAYCRAEDGMLRVDLPNLASFCYEGSAGQVRVAPHRLLSHDFIVDTYHHCVLPLILPALGTEVLHAGGVAGQAGVMVLCGESGTGKSTLAVALGRRGYALWADDAVAFDATGPEPTAIPLPFAVRLRAEAAQFLDAVGLPERSSPAASIGTEPIPLAGLCILRRALDAQASVEIERLGPAAACREALAHAYCFSVKDPAQKRRAVESYLALTAQVPAYALRFRPGVEHFGALLDAVHAIADGLAAQS
jgi:hypothetical protein